MPIVSSPQVMTEMSSGRPNCPWLITADLTTLKLGLCRENTWKQYCLIGRGWVWQNGGWIWFCLGLGCHLSEFFRPALFQTLMCIHISWGFCWNEASDSIGLQLGVNGDASSPVTTLWLANFFFRQCKQGTFNKYLVRRVKKKKLLFAVVGTSGRRSYIIGSWNLDS